MLSFKLTLLSFVIPTAAAIKAFVYLPEFAAGNKLNERQGRGQGDLCELKHNDAPSLLVALALIRHRFDLR